MNPCRLRFIESHLLGQSPTGKIRHRSAIDIGCGGGILTESLASRRWVHSIKGIDPCDENIVAAKSRARETGSKSTYIATSAEDLLEDEDSDARGAFDAVFALEVIEHVASPSAFISSCASLLARHPDATLFLSTLNRTSLSYALGIVAAERILGIVPSGTHDWSRFVTPEELTALVENQGLEVKESSGMILNPLTGSWVLDSKRLEMNYIMAVGWPDAENLGG
eukprot:g2324.t1